MLNTIDSPALNNYVFVCRLDEIPENKNKMLESITKKIAIFKYDHKISAVHSRYKHQLQSHWVRDQKSSMDALHVHGMVINMYLRMSQSPRLL